MLKIAITKEVNKRNIDRYDGVVANIDEPTDKLNEPIEEPKEQKPIEPEEYGWSYYSYDEERGEAYKSIILNNKGDATEIWFVGENDGQLPNRYPSGWNVNTLLYNDNAPISPHVMVEELSSIQEPNNWNIALDNIRREEKGKLFVLGTTLSSPLVPISPDYPPEYSVTNIRPDSPDYPPDYSVTNIRPDSPDYPPDYSIYNQNTPQYAPNGNTPPYSPGYNPNTPPYAPNSNTPPYSPGYNPNTPPYAPSYDPNGNSDNSMSSSGSIPPPPPSTSPENMYGGNVTVQTNDTTSELENINKMIKSTSNKRDDGIELIINTDDEIETHDKKEETDKENETEQGEKKIIKMN